jgi:hypothetical protein
LFDPVQEKVNSSRMDADEREIYYFLKSWKHEFIAGREIGRRAGGKRRFHSEPDWAKLPLVRMVERGILDKDPAGHYRIKPPPANWDKRKRRWVSPHIANLLKRSGKDYSDVIIVVEDEGLDEYYESL